MLAARHMLRAEPGSAALLSGVGDADLSGSGEPLHDRVVLIGGDVPGGRHDVPSFTRSKISWTAGGEVSGVVGDGDGAQGLPSLAGREGAKVD
jgi:hypothetical protein